MNNPENGSGQGALEFDTQHERITQEEESPALRLLEVCERLGYSPEERADVEEGDGFGHQVSLALGIAERNGGPRKRDQLYGELVEEGLIEVPKQDPQL